MKKIIFLLLILGVMVSSASAEIIYLKDGTVVNGKIVESGHYYIKVMQGKIPKQYYRDQIEKIMSDEEPFQWDPNKIDAGGFEGIPARKVLLIIDHLEANGARYNLQRNIEYVISKTPEKQKAKIKELLLINDIVTEIIPIYNSVYTEEELKTMNNFLKTPLGVKMIKSADDVATKTAEAMAEYFRIRLGDSLKL